MEAKEIEEMKELSAKEQEVSSEEEENQSDATSDDEESKESESSDESLEDPGLEVFSEEDFPETREGFEDLQELKDSEKKEISNDYVFQVLSRTQLHNVFKSKVTQIAQKFNYAEFDLSIFSETLQKRQYKVEDSCYDIQFNAITLLEERVKRDKVEDPEFEGFCSVCFMEIPEDSGVDFGCKHEFCIECMKEYLEIKIDAGPDCLRCKCPFEGCEFGVTSDIVMKTCKRKYFRT